MNINYKDYINDIPDFPIDGILYRDIQPLLMQIIFAFKSPINDMGQLVTEIPDYWVGIESRGFLFHLHAHINLVVESESLEKRKVTKQKFIFCKIWIRIWFR